MSTSDQHDEILYCQRCGISFLWSAEEQAAQQTGTPSKPTQCPGCRQLLPAPPRERGLVKWYNPRKHFGFLVRANDEEIFAHRRELKGTGHLRTGDLVEFSVGQSPKGPVAQSIRVLERAKKPEPNTAS